MGACYTQIKPSLVLKARHFSGSAFCNSYKLGVPEQALGGIPLGFGTVVEDIRTFNVDV